MARHAVDHKLRTGDSDLALGNHLAFLAQLLGRLGRPNEGVPYAEQAVTVFEEVLGAANGETSMVRALLAKPRTQATGLDTQQALREHRLGQDQVWRLLESGRVESVCNSACDPD